MQPMEIIRAYYPSSTKIHKILVTHGRCVAIKALAVANRLSTGADAPVLDFQFIEEAALLHDIGIFMTQTPELGCYGDHPYVCHGILGRRLLEEKGLFRHALVCERHVGVGLSASEIRDLCLPLPERDMRPVSLEEEIICYADKFFSKSPENNQRIKSVEEIVGNIGRYGMEKVEKFLSWVNRFEGG